MKNFNQIAIEGHLVREVEMVQAKEMEIAKFSIAVNGYKENECSFFDVTAFKKLAVTCGKYLKKGSHVLVGGELKQDTWKNKEGQSRSKVCIIANTVQFLTPKKESETTSDYQPQTEPPISFAPDSDEPIPF